MESQDYFSFYYIKIKSPGKIAQKVGVHALQEEELGVIPSKAWFPKHH